MANALANLLTVEVADLDAEIRVAQDKLAALQTERATLASALAVLTTNKDPNVQAAFTTVARISGGLTAVDAVQAVDPASVGVSPT